MTLQDLATLHSKAFTNTRAWSAQEFADLLSHPGAVLVNDDAAFVLMRVIGDEAEILTLATDPDSRRQGRARALLAKAEAAALNRGANTVFLEVADDNTAARALYAQAGFAQVGRRPDYYPQKDAAPVAALVLRKGLSTA